ncbi:MAG: YjbF family lipoprotein [Pelagimonas sp.]|jgi:hypothetical protein|nr:YjbF family lipoprotein [Pelagimonas sp.]
MKQIIISALALALLGACAGSGAQNLRILQQTLAQLQTDQKTPAADPRAQLSPSLLARQSTPLLYTELPAQQRKALMQPLDPDAQDVVVWLTADGASISLQKGIVIATRGLGNDLLTADLGQALQGIHKKRLSSVRVYRHLNGEDAIEITSFICDYHRQAERISTLRGEYDTTRITEDCAHPDTGIVNVYWVDRTGIVRKSRQWISTSTGYLTTERLVD